MSKAVSTPVHLDDWECEEDLRTLIRAKQIEKDPKRLAKVQALAKQKMLDVASVASDSPN